MRRLRSVIRPVSLPGILAGRPIRLDHTGSGSAAFPPLVPGFGRALAWCLPADAAREIATPTYMPESLEITITPN